MTILRKHALAALAAAAVGFASPANANTLTFQGVTFETLASGNTLQLTISNALTGGTGNWANIGYLKAFDFSNIGNVTGAALADWSETIYHGLATAAGCVTGDTRGACFYANTAIPLTDSITFGITFSGTDLRFDRPFLKVQFLTGANDAIATGDLLSQTIPVPEPEIYAMMALGLGLVGWAARRRKSKEAAGGR